MGGFLMYFVGGSVARKHNPKQTCKYLKFKPSRKQKHREPPVNPIHVECIRCPTLPHTLRPYRSYVYHQNHKKYQET
ncbi:hypothetical protein BDW42DRAFT_158572 [Aspergillus taichungensis]|uniref:Uncharacterized protein n=1 Tax=Aspergillus taichungensis TaxID=482145 RepID=A0A2J5I959_9EURO|nr:hypothetical protein BDW42DRAFT_158572 [Aspergillus taichungensis]